MFDLFASTMFRYIGRIFRNPMGLVPYLLVKKWMIMVYSTGFIALYIVLSNKAVQEKIAMGERVLTDELTNIKSIAQNCTTYVANADLNKAWQCFQKRPEYIPNEFDAEVSKELGTSDIANSSNNIKIDPTIYQYYINNEIADSNNSHEIVTRLEKRIYELYEPSNLSLGHNVGFEVNRDIIEKELEESYRQIIELKQRIIKLKEDQKIYGINQDLVSVLDQEIDRLTIDLGKILNLEVQNLQQQEDAILVEEHTINSDLSKVISRLDELKSDNDSTHRANTNQINELTQRKRYFEDRISIIQKNKEVVLKKADALRKRINDFNLGKH